MRRTILASVVALGEPLWRHRQAARAVDPACPTPASCSRASASIERNGVFYVSGVNDGGDVYRGRLGQPQLERWVDGTGTTGRGIDVDDARNASTSPGAHRGRCACSIATAPSSRRWRREAAGSFLNDVWVDRDGSVYVSDSSLPKIWRITSTAGAGGRSPSGST